MSIQDERELRARLGGLLDNIEPRPAPVARSVRRGRGIRVRRWISVAAGLAIIAAGAVLVPRLLVPHHMAPAAPLHYKVTVQQLGAEAHGGVIGAGVTDGKHWQVIASGTGTTTTIMTTGVPSARATFPVPTGSPASFQSEGGGPGNGAVVVLDATVAHNVTAISVSLPDGELLNLQPVAWHGYRWVAVVLPWRVPIVRAVAYSGTTELGYAVPFGDTELTVWWKPGQVPPRRATASIGSGVVDGISWQSTAYAGPWGYCYAFTSGTDCIDSASPQLVPAGQQISQMGCTRLGSHPDSPTAPTESIAAAANDVQKVVLRFSDGSTASFPVRVVGGQRVFGYAVPGHLRVVRSVEYGSAGQVVGSTTGAGWTC